METRPLKHPLISTLSKSLLFGEVELMETNNLQRLACFWLVASLRRGEINENEKGRNFYIPTF